MDKEMESEDVKGKRDAARRWANYVTADEQVGIRWRYLLVSELDVDPAKGSSAQLKAFGRRVDANATVSSRKLAPLVSRNVVPGAKRLEAR